VDALGIDALGMRPPVSETQLEKRQITDTEKWCGLQS